MSWWTEVLLTTTPLEDTGSEDAVMFPAIGQLNAWLRERNCGELFWIRNVEPTKHEPHACFAANCKGLDREGFIDAVLKAPWRWPEQVQLFLREEDDRGFREVIALGLQRARACSVA